MMFSDELKRAWQTCGVADPNSFDQLPNGRYITRIDAVRLNDARVVNGKQLPVSLEYELTVTEGEYAQTRCRKSDFINNDKSLSYIKLDFNTLRCQMPANLEDIGLALQNVVGKTIEIEIRRTTVSTGKEFVNTYIKRIVEVMPAPNAAQPAQPAQPQQNQQWQPAPQSQIDGYRQFVNGNNPGNNHGQYQNQYNQYQNQPFQNTQRNDDIPF